MPVSNEQYESILIRLNRLENSFNDLAVAISRCSTLSQVQQLLIVVQQSLADINARTEALEGRVLSIEEEPLN